MYSELLASALHARQDCAGEGTVDEARIRVLRCRERLTMESVLPVGPSWTSDTVADQLAYDVALIELARLQKVESDVRAFDRQAQERSRLERVLMVEGSGLAASSPLREGSARP